MVAAIQGSGSHSHHYTPQYARSDHALECCDTHVHFHHQLEEGKRSSYCPWRHTILRTHWGQLLYIFPGEAGAWLTCVHPHYHV